MYDLDELYQEVVLDHSRRPRNFRELADANRTAEGFNPLCGDQVRLYFRVEDGVIADVGFKATGCAISKASASLMTENVKGKSEEEAETLFGAFRKMITQQSDGDSNDIMLGDLEVLEGVSRFPARIKCATLSWHAMHEALNSAGVVTTTE
jgi:nitrogen fixation NifU-like protein